MLAYCKYKGIGILGYSPLMDGYLARPLGTDTPRSNSISGTPFEKRRRESDKTIIMRVQELADKRQWKMSQVPLSWVCSKITSPIIGMNSVRILPYLCVIYQRLMFLSAGKSQRVHRGRNVLGRCRNGIFGGAVSNHYIKRRRRICSNRFCAATRFDYSGTEGRSMCKGEGVYL